jgi:hypothetical protein
MIQKASGETMNKQSVSTCINCGLVGYFAGYHNLDKGRVSLCVTCAEEPIEVFQIRTEDSSGFFETTQSGFEGAIGSLVSEMDIEDDHYWVKKKIMTRLAVITSPEFEGF